MSQNQNAIETEYTAEEWELIRRGDAIHEQVKAEGGGFKAPCTVGLQVATDGDLVADEAADFATPTETELIEAAAFQEGADLENHRVRAIYALCEQAKLPEEIKGLVANRSTVAAAESHLSAKLGRPVQSQYVGPLEGLQLVQDDPFASDGGQA